MRLRQLTAHVLLLQYVMQDLLEREDIEAIHAIVKDAAADSSTRRGRTIIAIRKQLEHFAEKEMKRTAAKNKRNPVADYDDDPVEEDNNLDEQDQVLSDEDSNNGRPGRKTTGAQFGKDYNFKPYLASLATGDGWEAKKKRSECGSCTRSPPLNPFITSCGHLLCAPCYEEAEILAAEQDRPHATCRSCGHIFAYAHELTTAEESNMVGPETRSKKKRNNKAQEKVEQQDIAEEWLNLGGEGVLPSAKTIAIKAQLMNWFEKKDDTKPRKVIIYTQFLAMIRILAKVCHEEGWQTEQVRYLLDFQIFEQT